VGEKDREISALRKQLSMKDRQLKKKKKDKQKKHQRQSDSNPMETVLDVWTAAVMIITPLVFVFG
jgi:nitrogen fixation/metabolism regulation signal transduction histidine kinase